MTDRLVQLVRDIAPPRALVLGDFMLDRYVWGDVERVSPEAPVHVLDVDREEDRPGGAGNVAVNLRALGAEVVCIGLRGNDAEGRALVRLLKRAGADVTGLIQDKDRRTTLKTRMLAANQQVLRVDREDREPVSGRMARSVLAAYRQALKACDVIVIPDYAKGCVPPAVAKAVIAAARDRDVPVLVDPHRRADYVKYQGCTILKPNLAEAGIVLGDDPLTDAEVVEAGQTLRKQVRADAVVLTRGAAGMTLVRRGARPVHVRGLPRQVYDVTGAGDTVLAALAWALGGGTPLSDAVEIANVAASVVVGKLGSATVTTDELVHHLLDVHHAAGMKLVPTAKIGDALTPLRAAGKRIVFTNGCFDLLHIGHIRSLQFAKGLGDVLVVGLNTDASVRRTKGPGRPVLDEGDRAHILGALEAVDYIVLFSETTPLRLIKHVRPDVLVKGQDYTRQTVVGANFVEAIGGRVVLAPLIDGPSTSGLLDRIRGRGG